jgi:hypothetical protein
MFGLKQTLKILVTVSTADLVHQIKSKSSGYFPSKMTLEKRLAVGVCPSREVKKGKAVPLEALSGPEGSRKFRFPDFLTTAQDGGKVVSLTHRPHLPTGNTRGTHFC